MNKALVPWIIKITKFDQLYHIDVTGSFLVPFPKEGDTLLKSVLDWNAVFSVVPFDLIESLFFLKSF